jgi:membrane fusion protein
MSGSLFRREAVEHQKNRLLGDVILLQPLSLILMISLVLVICGLIITLLVGGRYARKETVSGYLVPDKGIVKMYAPYAGEIHKLHIREGEQVKQGQKLITLLSERALESGEGVDSLLLSELTQLMAELTKQITVEQALYHSEQLRYQSQLQGLLSEQQQIADGIALQEQRLTLARQRLEKSQKLKGSGHISATEYEKVYEELLTQSQYYQELLRAQVNKKNNYTQVHSEAEQLPLQSQLRIANFEKGISELKQRALEIQGRHIYDVVAPVNGKVDTLQASPGQWFDTIHGSQLLAIIPKDSTLLAEMYLPTRAIGFIEEGQSVNIRYAAFPYQRYGIYHGKIHYISQHIMHPSELPVPLELKEPVYRVIVALDDQFVHAYGKEMLLQAGMSFEAVIILDKRSLLQWILDPLYSLKGKV